MGPTKQQKKKETVFFRKGEQKRGGLFLTNLTNKQTWKTCLTDDDGRKTEERIREKKKKKLVMDVKIGRRRWRRRARAKQEEEPALPKSLLSIGSDSLEAKVENNRLWNCHFG